MKIRTVLTVALLVMLVVSAPVSAVKPEDRDCINNQFAGFNPFIGLGISYIPSVFAVLEFYQTLTEDNRIGIVCDDVAKYRVKINVGPGEYDRIILTNYVRETGPWQSRANQNLIILPGQSLTESFYSEMAIYYAREGYCVYVLDRRETNVPVTETDFSCMANWTVDEYLNDTYYGVAVSRIHTALLNNNFNNNFDNNKNHFSYNKLAEKVEVAAIGHSHGALILTAYEASEYDDLFLGGVDKVVPVEIIIKYDPAFPELIQTQALQFEDISEKMENGTYNADNMGRMMQLASLASSDPEAESPVQPGLTNRQVFRLMASQTYMFSAYPYTPDYHYWSGDLGGLYYVDENRVLSAALAGGAVPYAPINLDLYMAGLMGNVDGYEIDSSGVDSPLLYVGLGGGFGNYGSWWYENEVGKTNKKVSSIIWNDQGHGSIALDYNSPELWSEINCWLESN
ncbi:hypothetical protein ACSAZK_12795 [Methanosarcina sp. Mfa9]|uniref:hypothetical protein n=1 Tax=Methanosarcina sp. Mfa9 TaxID=3439063 RepID=UPI003F86891C